MEHLIANSGIQFIVKEVELNLSQPVVLSNYKTLKYAFCDRTDFLTNERDFDLLISNNEGVYIPYKEIEKDDKFERLPDGRIYYDEDGLPKLIANEPTVHYTNYKDSDNEFVSINSLESFRVHSPNDNHTLIPAFELLLGKWLPMPMFECDDNGRTMGTPYGWCRVKIDHTGQGAKAGINKYRLTWAFDTETTTDFLSNLRPCFTEDDAPSRLFKLCNNTVQMLGFMSTDVSLFSAFSDYIASLLGVIDANASYKYIGFYIYLVNYLRLNNAAPEVTLYYAESKQIPVDLVLDIGNSRTCGVLFEQSDFTKAMMLSLRNMSTPHISNSNPFDMRLVFRKCDFGDDIVLSEEMFSWRSFVRIGEEAKSLVYQSREEEGLRARTTNYSSPKRYLWDEKLYDGQWEFLTTTDDPATVRLSSNIYIQGLSDYFDQRGNYLGEIPTSVTDFIDGNTHYSRASLMTFVMIEIFQQAIAQINSIQFREKHGDIDCKRVLNNIVLTCPTAMPRTEQIKLRQCAHDAYAAISKCMNIGGINIIPSIDSLKITDKYESIDRKTWSFDEASCCQLVYLYAEIAQKYSGEVQKFFNLKGKTRPELIEEGYTDKALTIGSIDIGAGTTDIMICTYKRDGDQFSRLTPKPLWWDSFYLAGDDILRNVIQNVIIEGPERGLKDMGNITSALTARILDMDDHELSSIPSIKTNKVYEQKVEDIKRTHDPETVIRLKRALASNLIHDFFGQNSAMMGYKDRQCRVDFNTQISHPMSQTFLNLLRMKRPSAVYSYEDLFDTVKPAAHLLDYFANHFGFRFEDLLWRFDPEEITSIVKSTLEPLMKQMSEVFYAYDCDVIVLAGRPTSLDATTELFVKYLPISPNRLVRLNDYRVGQWFPFADGQGYFYDQKAVVAVGAMVGLLASQKGFNGLSIDFSEMISNMDSTANYLGLYNTSRRQVEESILTPSISSATINISVFPAFIGAKQLNSVPYQARPMFALYYKNSKTMNSLRVVISRNIQEDKEKICIEEIIDNQGNSIPKDNVELIQQSIVDDGKHWLDKGEFELAIR